MWIIESKAGCIFGIYDGADEEEALRKMEAESGASEPLSAENWLIYTPDQLWDDLEKRGRDVYVAPDGKLRLIEVDDDWALLDDGGQITLIRTNEAPDHADWKVSLE